MNKSHFSRNLVRLVQIKISITNERSTPSKKTGVMVVDKPTPRAPMPKMPKMPKRRPMPKMSGFPGIHVSFAYHCVNIVRKL